MTLTYMLVLFVAMADLRGEWNSLVDAEKSFAKASIEKGTREAFLSVLAEDSIIFRPTAVQGRTWFQSNAPSPAQLSWEPEFADISSSGDLGYTTGPWEVRRAAQEPPGAFGHYVTLWRKQANGSWKVLLDNGISHERGPKPSNVASPSLAKDVAASRSRQEIESARSALAAADKTAIGSLLAYVADDVRVYRDGNFPFVGKAAAEKTLSQPQDPKATQAGAFISNSADLGYTYGATVDANYVRIWKKQRDGSWKIVLDMLNPLPKR